jgi:hypothetical protein
MGVVTALAFFVVIQGGLIVTDGAVDVGGGVLNPPPITLEPARKTNLRICVEASSGIDVSRSEVLEKLNSEIGSDAFRMELQAFDRQCPVPHPHDIPIVGGCRGDLKFASDAIPVDHQ